MPEFSTIVNPNQPLNDETRAAQAARRQAISDELALRERPDFPVDFAQEYSRELEAIHDLTGRAQGVDPTDIRRRLQTVRDKKTSYLTRELTNRIGEWRTLVGAHPVIVADDPPPVPTDPSFWWANSSGWAAQEATADFRNDGFHVNGGPQEHEDNASLLTSSGLLANFTLQRERMPATQNGFYTSSPHVELFGGLVAYASDYQAFVYGHSIAACDLVLRQTLYQYGFGQAPGGGAARLIVAEARATRTLINLEDTGFSRHVDLPGYTFVPPVRFHESQITVAGDLQAEIEVRFEIFVKAGGALVWCDPEIIVRTFQWPLLADV